MWYLNITGLRDLRISTRVFDEISYSCDGQSVVLSVGDGQVNSTNSSGVAMRNGEEMPVQGGKQTLLSLFVEVTYVSNDKSEHTFWQSVLCLYYLGIFGVGDGLIGLARTALTAIESVAVENDNIVQVRNFRQFFFKSVYTE